MGDARDVAMTRTDDAASTSYASALGSVAQGWSAQEWSFDSRTTTISAKASEALQELNNVDVRAMAETIAERASEAAKELEQRADEAFGMKEGTQAHGGDDARDARDEREGRGRRRRGEGAGDAGDGENARGER